MHKMQSNSPAMKRLRIKKEQIGTCRVVGCGSKDIADYDLRHSVYLCRSHSSEKNKKRYLKYREKILFRQKELKTYGTITGCRTMLNWMRTWDIRTNKSTACDLVPEELLLFQKKGCFYCLDKEVKIGLDRIDNSKGHSKDNVVPCCKDCNKTRGDRFTVEEFVKIAEVIKEIKNLRKQ